MKNQIKKISCILFILFCVRGSSLSAAMSTEQSVQSDFDKAQQSWKQKLDESMRELSELQEQIKTKNIDL